MKPGYGQAESLTNRREELRMFFKQFYLEVAGRKA